MTKLKSLEGIALIKKQRRIIQTRAKRRKAKEHTQACLLKRKIPKRISSILKVFPNIGSDIEQYVRSRRCGADAWRRTGVTTFDGHRKRWPNVSFERIQDHLRKTYNMDKIGGCCSVMHSKKQKKLSAQRYKGDMQVVTERF